MAGEHSLRLHVIQHLLALAERPWQTRQVSIGNESDFMKTLNPSRIQTTLMGSLLLGLLFASMAKASGCANIRTACHEVDGARGVA
jgi:hypothetical protein